EERRGATAEARKRALAVLDRVLAISHADDPGFPTLVQCQAKAKALRNAVMDPKAFETGAAPALETTPAFAALLTLIEGREQLDDERFAALEDSVTQSFGRPLAVAATRGKLSIAGAVTPAAPPAALRPSPQPPSMLEEAVRSVLVPPAAPPAAPAPPPPAPAPVVASAPAAPAEEDVGAAQAVEQAVQDEAAQWWVSAWARWTSWKSTLAFGDAVKQELSKYSYLLSVPVQKSTDYEEGLLSYCYSIQLEHVERQSAGFVARALNSLKTFTPGPGKSVGAHLYSFLITEGRLPELYPEFVKSVLVAAVPDPGVWTTARILESTLETRVFTHPSARLGDPEHNSQRLTQDRQRFTDHRFQLTLPPLTTRFFAVAADLKEPRSIDVKLTENRADSDRAWLLTMPPAGRADLKSELLRLPPEGTSLPGLGKDYATLWVAVFNTDPSAEKKYELTLSLRKEAGKASAATFKSARG
ncbi:MAG: hypothetical protein HY729_06495, partial [Candidatus Rokubacteria bacterium]|nr:hypothetical protein [Candidatus Rokubacteria bacterium]